MKWDLTYTKMSLGAGTHKIQDYLPEAPTEYTGEFSPPEIAGNGEVKSPGTKASKPGLLPKINENRSLVSIGNNTDSSQKNAYWWQKRPNGQVDEKAQQNRKLSVAEGQSADTANMPKPTGGRFKRLAKKIKTNLAWVKDIHEKQDDDADAFVVKSTGDNPISFDINNFKFGHRSYGGLTKKARRILMKHPMERTNDELDTLRDVVNRLKCFEKYSRKVKQELARVISYEMFDDGRVIIQQGHIGVSFYFIISGAVSVRITEYDKRTGQRHKQVLGELGEGSSFGELALLHNIKRQATIVCKGSSEFLRVDKDDFEAVLRVSYEEEWGDRLKWLRHLPYFRDWTDEALTMCNNKCKIKEFPAGQVIMGNTAVAPECVHFILMGECHIVRDLVLIKDILPSGNMRLSLPKKKLHCLLRGRQQMSDKRRGTIFMSGNPERHVWTLCTLGQGYYFGAGENLKDTYVVTKTKVECLLVPRVKFYIHGHGHLLDSFRENLNSALPDNERAFQYYITQVKWENYKEKLVKEIVTRKNIQNPTTLMDVPENLRNDTRWKPRN